MFFPNDFKKKTPIVAWDSPYLILKSWLNSTCERENYFNLRSIWESPSRLSPQLGSCRCFAAWTSSWYLDGPSVRTVVLRVFDGPFVPGGGLEPKHCKEKVIFWQRLRLVESFELLEGATLTRDVTVTNRLPQDLLWLTPLCFGQVFLS